MNRRVLMVIAAMLVLLPTLPAHAEKIVAKPVAPNRWQLQTEGNRILGTVFRTDTGNFRMYLPGGRYIGLLIRSTKKFRPARTTRHPLVSEAAARLYLATLQVMDTLPASP